MVIHLLLISMIIKSLELLNYRNYINENIIFDKGINILYGDNAQGKTNILEAIYLSITSKSHRSSNDKELINFSKDESHIKLIIEKKEIENRIDIHIRKNKSKGIAINSLALKRASELFGMANVIFFSPEDLGIIKNGPSERRKFIDMELCQLDKIYLHSLMEYNKILNQRNKLLKEIGFKTDLEDTLDIWDAQLIRYGKEIIKQREYFICLLNNIIKDIHSELTTNKEELEIVYDKNVSIEEFEKKLKKYRDNDLRLKNTNIGPHRDDIAFFIKFNKNETIDARKFASQGQQRTVALSLKLAEIELVKDFTSDYPILLLDDVLSELDESRQTKLLDSIKHIQAIISCTGIEDFINRNMSIGKLFLVKNGKVSSDIK